MGNLTSAARIVAGIASGETGEYARIARAASSHNPGLMTLSRRSFIAGAAAGSLTVFVRSARASEFTVVPAAEIQQVPFAFRSASHAHQAMDGALGAFLRQELEPKGLIGFQVGAFDNGMRQITTSKHPIVVPADLAGIKMRVPAGQLV